jgi:hypothetical protein
MDLNDSFGIKSSFQIVPEERYAVSPSFLENIRSRGFEIDIHDLNHDGLLYSDRTEFLRRAERINRYAHQFGALGFRWPLSTGKFRVPRGSHRQREIEEKIKRHERGIR